MKRAIRWILLIFFLGVFCFAGYKLVSTLYEYKKAENFYEETAGAYVVAEARSDAPEEAQEVRKVQPGDSPAAYVRDDGEEVAPITIDFDSLLADNGDVIGWLYCEDTPVNYPVVQSGDNEFYLHRMLDGSYSTSGSIFLDYQCSPDFTYDNSILYGHNMRNGSMFHTLVEYNDQEYYDAHPVLYLLTPDQNYAVKLFAGFVTDSDGWAYVLQFGSEAEKAEYLARAVSESTFEALVAPSASDHILTLSTCSYEYNDARYVVMGILTPIS